MKRVGVVVATAAITLLLAALARAPYTPPGAGTAVLRFSWRMSVSARENCRPRTHEELEELPVHMRTPEVCTRDQARYMLITRIDERSPADTLQLVRGGVKGDRPLFILVERTLPPGEHRLQVRVQRTSETSGHEILAELDTVVVLHAGRTQLVTSDDGRLTVRSSAPSREEEEEEDEGRRRDPRLPAAGEPHRRDDHDDAEDRARPREQRRTLPQREHLR